MAAKNNKDQGKKDFLEAKMYYYNNDPLAERDIILNSRESRSAKKNSPDKSNKQNKLSAQKTSKVSSSKRSGQTEKALAREVLQRLDSLQESYKDLAKKLNYSKVSVEVDSTLKNSEDLEQQINQLEQEKLTLLEQITVLEEQLVLTADAEAEKNELRQKVQELNQEKIRLETTVTDLNKEMDEFKQTVAKLENKKSIVYFSKERDDLETLINVLKKEKKELYLQVERVTEENKYLHQQMSSTQEKDKTISYLDRKCLMLEEDLKQAEFKAQSISDKINVLQTAVKEISEEKETLEEKILLLEKQREANFKLAAELDETNEVKANLNSQIEKYKAENEDLSAQINELKKSVIDPEKHKRLSDRADELEQERLNLFKIITDLEEEKKVIPYLDEKNSMLQEEIELLKNNNAQARQQLKEFTKNAQNMEKELERLKAQSGSRLELEQEKGRLKKKIKNLEEQAEIHLKQMAQLEKQLKLSKNSDSDIDKMRSEIIALQEQNGILSAQSDKDKLKIERLNEEIVSLHKAQQLVKGKVEDLIEENQQLIEKSDLKTGPETADYLLDIQKLAELKDFVLESIQTRRWKSTEFVNGAYDAVGLFYRTILHERPIKRKE